MSATTPCRIIVDEPAGGAWNMAVDEALLESAADTGECVLRFYQWQEPTLSLGYFQRWQERQAHVASLHCDLVRRPSGGGAILHDRELTYCFVAPAGHPLARDAESLYRAIHGTLIETLDDLDVPASLCASSDEAPDDDRASRAFLCFQRRSPGDVLLGDAKIVGSAQRRWSSAVLQHGSILLSRSPAAPELEGIEQLAGVPISAEMLAELWQPPLMAALRLSHRKVGLTAAEATAARGFLRDKYDQARWNLRA